MAKKMLIDASHPEEMRMAIMDGKRLEGFETESFSKKQLKGSIYLAKVIRVEPSLQAAFVDFGGNRQGFLPFTEIHPDYYHIPVGDRLEDHVASSNSISSAHIVDADTISIDVNDPISNDTDNSKESHVDSTASQPLEMDSTSLTENAAPTHNDALDDTAGLHSDEPLKDLETPNDNSAEITTDENDDFDEESIKRHPLKYRYKIQEVIKRRQVMLVQVVKEERGGKGAALTTYLSLPGRYCVLMPNSGERRGGISRKISDLPTRKRIRGILDSLDLLEGMSLIVRTAGSDKNKTEIRKDFEYLLRLWSDIREKTLTSIAPASVYSEGDLIKRALRDAYTKDIEHVLIDGEDAYKSAKNLMKTMSPTQAKKIQLYKEKHISLFQHYHIEDMVDEMFQPTVSLPSGGSIVIAQTEALVAIDVNSGKATRERHITDTAYKTNIEAAKEVARQLRLRDLGGIIVVDFIDMNDRGHIAQVEKIFKESLQSDRARIQLGKISQFGLLEMSRQRLRPSLMESSTRQCSHCHGTGLVRSIESMALFILRQLEGASVSNPKSILHVSVPSDVDTYLLNKKRRILVEFETKYNVTIDIRSDKRLKNTEHHLNITSETDETAVDKGHDQKALEHHHPSHHKEGRHQNHKQHQHGAKDDHKARRDKHRQQQQNKQSQETANEKRTIHVGEETSTVAEKNQHSVHSENTSTHEQKKRRNKRRRSSKKTMADAITADLMAENTLSGAPQIMQDTIPSLEATTTDENHKHLIPSNENQAHSEGKRRKRRRPDRRRSKTHAEKTPNDHTQESPIPSTNFVASPVKEALPEQPQPASLSDNSNNDASRKNTATRTMNRKKKSSKNDASVNKSNDKEVASHTKQEEKQKEPTKKSATSDASKTAQNDGAVEKEESKSKAKKVTDSEKTKSKKSAGTDLAKKRDIIVTKEEAHAPKTDAPSQDRVPKRKKGLWGRLFDTSEG